MACSLGLKLDAAINAAREAFDLAHEKDSLTDSDLNLLFVYYQGLKKIKNGIPEHTHDGSEGVVNVQFPDGTYNPDYNITLPTESDWADVNLDTLGENVVIPSATGDDVITFS